MRNEVIVTKSISRLKSSGTARKRMMPAPVDTRMKAIQ